MLAVKVRRATPDDAPGMMRVHLDCMNNSYPGFYSDECLEKWASSLKLKHYTAKIESTTGWCYVAVVENTEHEEELVGYAHLNTNHKSPEPIKHGVDVQIESLYVSAFHQKCGIGRKLLEEMEDKAKKKHFTKIGILSSKFATCFYEKMGYSIESELFFNISAGKFCDTETLAQCDDCATKVMTKSILT